MRKYSMNYWNWKPYQRLNRSRLGQGMQSKTELIHTKLSIHSSSHPAKETTAWHAVTWIWPAQNSQTPAANCINGAARRITRYLRLTICVNVCWFPLWNAQTTTDWGRVKSLRLLAFRPFAYFLVQSRVIKQGGGKRNSIEALKVLPEGLLTRVIRSSIKFQRVAVEHMQQTVIWFMKNRILYWSKIRQWNKNRGNFRGNYWNC